MGGFVLPSIRIGGSAAAPGIPIQDVPTTGLYQMPGLDGVGVAIGGQPYYELTDGACNIGYRPVPAYSIAALAASPYAGVSTSVQQESTSDGRFVISANSALGFGVSVFSRNIVSGDLTPAAGSPFVPTIGRNGSAIALSKDNLFAYCSSSSFDDIQVLAVNQTTGALALVQTVVGLGAVPAAPSPTSIHVTADNNYVMCADFNSIHVYRRNTTTGVLTEVAGSPFASGTTVFGITSTPDGAYVYAANAGDATVSAFSWNTTTEILTPLVTPTYATGAWPTGIEMHPAGIAVYIANKNGASISAFLIDQTTGALTAVAGSPVACSANPWQVSLSSDGTKLVAGGATMAAYTVDSVTGVLTPIAGSPFATGGTTQGIAFTPDDLHVYAGVNGALTLGGYATTAAPTFNLINLIFDPSGGMGGQLYFNGRIFLQGGEVANGYRTANVTPLPAPVAATAYTALHGCTEPPKDLEVELICLANDSGYLAGDVVKNIFLLNAGVEHLLNCSFNATMASFTIPAGYTLGIQNAATGLPAVPTPANWAYRFYVGP